MRIKITHHRDNPVSGKSRPIRLHKVRLTTSPTSAVLELTGASPEHLQVRLTLAGLLLYCPYGKTCPCWIELLPTAQGERKATTEAFKHVVERTASRIVAVFAFRESLPRLQDGGGDEDWSLVLAERMQGQT
jgi:hypothetical protein